jgi:hypothetical protein
MDEQRPLSIHRFGDRAERRYGLVLVLLLCNFVLFMAGSSANWVRSVSVGLTGATLLAALLAAEVEWRLRRVASICAAVAFLGSLTLLALGRSSDGVEGLLDAALVVVAPVAIGRSIVRRRIIDVQTVMAALCIYVFLALWWAFVYQVIGAIGSSPFFAQQAHASSADFVYFSFITQLTIGYGDLAAAGNFGRAGAVLEGLLGQIYLVTIVALLVSRLVPGATVTRSSRTDDPDTDSAQ